MQDYSSDLLYGKSKLERIVSIEVNANNTAELFIQDENNNVYSKQVENKYWILSSNEQNVHGKKWAKLKGNLFYKYGIQFDKKIDWINYRKAWYNNHIYSIYDSRESLMIKDGYTYFKGLNFKDVSVLSFDIETTSLERNSESKVLLISNTFRKGDQIERKLFTYKDEKNMFSEWCNWVREKDPSILITHNGSSFDLPYLEHCASMQNIPLLLGRDGSAIKFEDNESRFRKEQGQYLYFNRPRIYGREHIDTFFLSIKYDVGRKYESYGLKKIIEQEGMQSEGRIFYDASQIRFNYTDPVEWEKIKAYCIFDSDDALKLYDLMAPSYFYLSQSVPKTFQNIVEVATGSILNSILVRSYLQMGHSIPHPSKVNPFKGAISIGNPGIYKNCLKVDVASLYPSIILQYNIYDSYKDPERNFLNMVKSFREERLKNKRLAKETGISAYTDLEQAQKILINSCYGLLGADGLNFNYPKGAMDITNHGREILKKAILWATGEEFIELTNEEDDLIDE